jgi:hypothetical protein
MGYEYEDPFEGLYGGPDTSGGATGPNPFQNFGLTEADRQAAKKLAFMRAGMGVLAANKPGPYPQNTLSLLGQGGLHGMDAYQGDLRARMGEKSFASGAALKDAQMKKLGRDEAAATQQQQRISAFAESLPPEQRAAYLANPQEFLKALYKEQLDTKPQVVPAGGALVPRGDSKPSFTNPHKPEATPNEQQLYEYAVANNGYKGTLVEFMRENRKAGATRVDVNAYQPASVEAQRDFIRSTRTTYDQLKHAPVALESIDKAKALIPDAKGFMGPAGESLLEGAKFLNNRMGMNINTEGVKSAEELRTRIFFNIMDNLKKMDAQPSQLQQQIMMESLGKLGTDPNALPAVLDAFADVIEGKVNLHNQEVRGAVERGVMFPYDPEIKLPKRGGGGKKDEAMNSLPPPNQHRGRTIEDSSGKRFKSDGMSWKPL